MPEKTASNQGCFKPGQSGNPFGRPKGARNATTRAIELLLEGEGESITRKAIEAALSGDMAAIKIVLDRICPPRRSRPIQFDLPSIVDAVGVAEAQREVIRATCTGELMIEEAQAITGLLEVQRKCLETQDLEARLSELEARAGSSHGFK